MATYVRELSIPDVLRGSVEIYRAHFLRILGVYFLPVFPAAALQAIAQLEKWERVTLLAMILGLILQLVAQGALTIAVSDVCLGYKPSAKRSYRRLSASTFGRLLVTGLQVTLLLFGLAILAVVGFGITVGAASAGGGLGVALAGAAFAIVFVIFCIWFFLSAMFVAPIVVLEGQWGLAAIKRSRRLAKGFLWRNLGAFLLLFLAITIAAGIVGGVLGLLIPIESHAFNLTVVAIQHLVAAPLALILILLLYYDLRARKEGYNMTTLAEDLMR